jgi:hypothetical protein
MDGMAQPSVAVAVWPPEGRVPPSALKVMVYCAAACVVALCVVRETLTVAVGDT